MPVIRPLTITDKQLCEELESIVKHLAESEQKRNTIVHTTWTVFSDGKNLTLWSHKFTAKNKKGLMANLQEDVKLEAIHEALNHIKASQKLLGAYIRKIQPLGLMSIRIFKEGAFISSI